MTLDLRQERGEEILCDSLQVLVKDNENLSIDWIRTVPFVRVWPEVETRGPRRSCRTSDLNSHLCLIGGRVFDYMCIRVFSVLIHYYR